MSVAKLCVMFVQFCKCVWAILSRVCVGYFVIGATSGESALTVLCRVVNLC